MTPKIGLNSERLHHTIRYYFNVIFNQTLAMDLFVAFVEGNTTRNFEESFEFLIEFHTHF